jgi:glycosyltransferase involved in cell wall biosynthesis
VDTRLTVILAVYNGMPYLPKAVESILSQSFSSFRFVIVNDGSTDNSRQYLETISDPRVLLINQRNAGQGAARNAALSECHSEYVAVMDQDDVSLTERFRSQIAYLDAHPDVAFVGTQIEFLIGDVKQRGLAAPVDHNEIEERLLSGRAGICHPSLMYRREAAIACGGYPTGVFGEDIDFCLRMMEYGRSANLDDILFQYRLHRNQASLARCKELISANQFAAYKAKCRRDRVPQLSMGEFLQGASLLTKLKWSLEAWELTQYRSARINLASHQPVAGGLRLAAIGLLSPIAAIRRVARCFGR